MVMEYSVIVKIFQQLFLLGDPNTISSLHLKSQRSNFNAPLENSSKIFIKASYLRGSSIYRLNIKIKRWLSWTV